MISCADHALIWERLETLKKPPARSRHVLVADLRTGPLVLFGGIEWSTRRVLSDTWELHADIWTRRETAATLPARQRGGMVFDSRRGCFVLFGGLRPSWLGWRPLNDTWFYRDGGWSQCRTPYWNTPVARSGHVMAFDPTTGATILFGGVDAQHRSLGDTWLFNGEAWRAVAGKGPCPRRYAAFAYHPELGGCVLHGGAEDDRGRRKLGDTWLFRDGRWVPLGRSFQTAPRDDHALAFHRELGVMVMTEGLLRENRVIKREMLTMTSSGWDLFEMEHHPPRVQCSPLTYDEARQGLVQFGGEQGHMGPQFDHTLILRSRTESFE